MQVVSEMIFKRSL